MENKWNQEYSHNETEAHNINDEFYKKQETKRKNRELKKENNKLARLLLLYNLIMIGVMIGLFAVLGFGLALSGKGDIDKTFDYLENSGWSYLLSCVLGVLIVRTNYKKFYGIKSIRHENKKITPKIFLAALSFSVATQLIFIFVGNIIENLLNVVQLSAVGSTKQATMVSTTITMFLYVSIIGPIVEELFFRGLVLRVFEARGKIFAVIASSLLFAVFHGNLVQGIFAFSIGLVFAYVTLEYSIKWSIVLHIFNNLILSDVIGILEKYIDSSIVNIVYLLFLIVCTVAAIIIAICRRREIYYNLREEQEDTKIGHPYRNLFSSSWVIIYIIILIVVAIGSLQTL